jgi:hypothetical protein
MKSSQDDHPPATNKQAVACSCSRSRITASFRSRPRFLITAQLRVIVPLASRILNHRRAGASHSKEKHFIPDILKKKGDRRYISVPVSVDHTVNHKKSVSRKTKVTTTMQQQ